MISTLLIFIILGAIAGLLAGLLGIGGGLVIVPILYFALPPLGVSEAQLMHVALGTSLATIIFTSISSMRAHNSRGAIRWDIFKRITPGILIGTFLGSCFASYLNTNVLKVIFVIFLYYVASQMLLGLKPKASRQVPEKWGLIGAGGAIGAMSSLVGIGGGTLSVPFLTMCNIQIHTAIGTAAAIGLPLALAGTAGYIWTGIGVQGLPSWSIGYVFLPALIGIVCTSMLTAPYGAKLAHSLPVAKLKMIFAILLFLVATKMLISLF
ncbi:sulfite exporter TauE/SafE family protein [Desulfovibrio sp. UCD-KL4C]|uniref:sulfite exporter TauE/SafE family protein n=1 Tax=Desulfovibrio sp. UCD-KL4C TaxID=2578120 RepID=UPI0025C53B42|nr:sulfite exporter TauE/SafE family protein [Desulfovibrio sp. UCD-KL4C]